MKSKKLKPEQVLKKCIQVDNNLYFFKDNKGVVWQLLKTPYKEIPITILKEVI